jgi:hypothetical protein
MGVEAAKKALQEGAKPRAAVELCMKATAAAATAAAGDEDMPLGRRSRRNKRPTSTLWLECTAEVAAAAAAAVEDDEDMVWEAHGQRSKCSKRHEGGGWPECYTQSN